MPHARELETIREGESDIDDALESARSRILAGEDPDEVLAEEFGLEPDYLFDPELGL